MIAYRICIQLEAWTIIIKRPFRSFFSLVNIRQAFLVKALPTTYWNMHHILPPQGCYVRSAGTSSSIVDMIQSKNGKVFSFALMNFGTLTRPKVFEKIGRPGKDFKTRWKHRFQHVNITTRNVYQYWICDYYHLNHKLGWSTPSWTMKMASIKNSPPAAASFCGPYCPMFRIHALLEA